MDRGLNILEGLSLHTDVLSSGEQRHPYSRRHPLHVARGGGMTA